LPFKQVFTPPLTLRAFILISIFGVTILIPRTIGNLLELYYLIRINFFVNLILSILTGSTSKSGGVM